MNLRERARFAWLDRLAAAERDLHDHAMQALRDVLADQTIGDRDLEVVKLEPFTQPAQAFYKLEGLDFRVNVKTVEHKNASNGPNPGLRWDETEIEVAVCRRQAFVTIEDLGDLGKSFKDEPLPDPDATVDEPASTGAEA